MATPSTAVGPPPVVVALGGSTSDAPTRSTSDTINQQPSAIGATVNPALAQVLGYTVDELTGRSAFDVQSEAGAAQVRSVQWHGRDTSPRSLEVDLKRADGTWISTLLTLAPRLRGLENDGKIGVFTDLTERKHMEAALLEARDTALAASRAKSAFLATMSHEIRSPINGVIGMTALLLDTELTTQQREQAESVERSGEALLTIINDILDFSKVEAGKLDLEILDLDVRELLEDLVKLFAPRAQTKGLDFGCIVDHCLPHVLRGDPGRVRQILTNLVGNALKFTSQGQVLVRAQLVEQTDEGALVRFAVTDSGIGISPEARWMAMRRRASGAGESKIPALASTCASSR